jgi:glycosyltransferase involved in cell wall biosynthesis
LASETAPVLEAIRQNETGRLINFFDKAALTDNLCDLLEDTKTRETLGTNARLFARENYDLKSICLPRQLKWVSELS